jgi:hypothetical protein
VLDAAGNVIGQSASVDKLYSWSSVSPRIGFNWKLTKDGKTVLKAHWGRYYRGVLTGEFSALSPTAPPIVAFSGEYDAQGNRIGEEIISDNSNLRLDSGFKNPYTDQFIAGVERELAKDLAVGVTYVNKRGHDYGAWKDVGATYVPVTYRDTVGTEATGDNITVFRRESDPSESLFFLTNPSEMFTRVDAVTVQLQKRMANNWQATASFVYTNARGRLGSSNAGPIGSVSSSASRFGRDPNDYVNTDGKLTHDRPVTVKLQLVYMLPKGFLIGANYNYQQGRPWARLAQLPSDLVNRSSQILAEPMDGSRRVGSWNLLDLRLQKQFKVSKSAQFALFADLLNTLNNDANDSVGSRLGTSDSFGLRTDFVLPRRLMVGAKFTF